MGAITVGDLLSKSVSTLRDNFAAFFLFAALSTMASQALIHLFGISDLITQAADPTTFQPSSGTAISLLVTSFGMIVLYAFATGSIVFGAVRFLDNDPATHGDCVGEGVRRAPALIGMGMVLAVLAGIAMSVGTVAGGAMLAIPLLILAIFFVAALFVAAPALVMEGAGIIAALRRSLELTKGARMQILGLLGVLACFSLGVSLLLIMVLTGITWIDAVIAAAVDAIFIAFGTVATAVAYHELRARKDGAAVAVSDFD